MEDDFGSLEQENLCIQGVSHDITSPSFTVVYIIPLYKLLIYPCLRYRDLSIFKFAGIGAVALIVSSVSGGLAEIMQQVGKTECMFEQTNPEENKLINFIIGIPFNFCLAFTAIVFNNLKQALNLYTHRHHTT